jgi:hypothetical protein
MLFSQLSVSELSVSQMSFNRLSVSQMSAVKMSIVQMSVAKMFDRKMSVGHVAFEQKTAHLHCNYQTMMKQSILLFGC